MATVEKRVNELYSVFLVSKKYKHSFYIHVSVYRFSCLLWVLALAFAIPSWPSQREKHGTTYYCIEETAGQSCETWLAE